MNAFSYITPLSPEAAVEAVRPRGRFIAGGIDLLGELKESIATPAVLVNVKALPGLDGIRRSGSGWSLGANVTLAALAGHADLRRSLPGVAEAAAEVGSPQIRNVATMGGNLAQHSRCWYYRHRDVQCRKKGGRTCFAREGECKYHAIIRGSVCLSPLVSNLAVAFAALDARVRVQRGRKVEALTLAQLYETAWKDPDAHHSLRPDDLILGVDVPEVAGTRSVYLQMSERGDFDWALVSCAAAATLSEGRLRHVRIVLGAVAPIPWQVEAANTLLEGRAFTAENADRAADLLLHEARPFADNAYKLPIARALVRRALTRLAE